MDDPKWSKETVVRISQNIISEQKKYIQELENIISELDKDPNEWDINLKLTLINRANSVGKELEEFWLIIDTLRILKNDEEKQNER